MNATLTRPTWTDTPDYSREWIATSDPRIVAVIERDTDSSSSAPDGDGYAPAYWIEHRGYSYRADSAGHTFADDDAATAYVHALDAFGRDAETVARYMRIFHGTHLRELDSQSGRLVLLNTPAFRTHVGLEDANGTRALNGAGEPIADEVAYGLDGEADTWRAYLDGDVHGVGYAVLPERVTDETPIPDDLDGWEVEIQCWGFYGAECARESAADMEYGAPNLPELLPAA